MDLVRVTEFFQWALIINLAIYVMSVGMIVFCNEWMIRVQQKFFDIEADNLKVLLYSYIALYKILFIVFILVPYLSLLVIS